MQQQAHCAAILHTVHHSLSRNPQQYIPPSSMSLPHPPRNNHIPPPTSTSPPSKPQNASTTIHPLHPAAGPPPPHSHHLPLRHPLLLHLRRHPPPNPPLSNSPSRPSLLHTLPQSSMSQVYHQWVHTASNDTGFGRVRWVRGNRPATKREGQGG